MAHENGSLSIRSDNESQEVQSLFLKRLAMVSDGSAYTTKRLSEIFEVHKDGVVWFVRQCDVSPAVSVHRHYMKKGEVAYTFIPTQMEGKERMLRLLTDIVEDNTTSGRSKTAARTVIVLLGGTQCTSP